MSEKDVDHKRRVAGLRHRGLRVVAVNDAGRVVLGSGTIVYPNGKCEQKLVPDPEEEAAIADWLKEERSPNGRSAVVLAAETEALERRARLRDDDDDDDGRGE